jgi:hypothetical protein
VETEKWESSELPKQKVSEKRQALETAEMGHAAVNRSTARRSLAVTVPDSRYLPSPPWR